MNDINYNQGGRKRHPLFIYKYSESFQTLYNFRSLSRFEIKIQGERKETEVNLIFAHFGNNFILKEIFAYI